LKLSKVGYQPTQDGEAFFREIQRFIYEHLDHFEKVGKRFDALYSHAGLLRRTGREALIQHREAREVNEASRRLGERPKRTQYSRAWHRKTGISHMPNPLRRDCADSTGGRYADGKRKPTIMLERILQAVCDIEMVAQRGLHLQQSPQRKIDAETILLMTWLLTDPDAHTRTPRLTDFQCWGWFLIDAARIYGRAIWLEAPDAIPDPHFHLDQLYDRFCARLSIFNDYPKWIEWARWAWETMQETMPTESHKRRQSSLGGEQAMTFPIGNKEGTSECSTVPKLSRIKQRTWLASAMLLVRDHPELSDAEVARQVVKNKSTLARSREYRVAAALARGAGLPSGTVMPNLGNNQQELEAIGDSLDPCAPASRADDVVEDLDDQIDREMAKDAAKRNTQRNGMAKKRSRN
jgi:hypothetical protein